MEQYSFLTVTAALILVCVCSSKLSSRLNMPSMLLFLAVGMLAGSEGIGQIDFSNATAANLIGTTALVFILFSGGFDTSWKSIRPILTPGGILSSAGVLLTATICGLFCYYLFSWAAPELEVSLPWSLLLGSIISSTDAAAVFSILRSKSVSLKGNLKSLLEFESGSNDPMAAFLTIFLLGIVQQESAGDTAGYLTYLQIFPSFLLKMTIGITCGLVFGKAATWLFNHLSLDYDGLYYVTAVAVALFSFAGTELCAGNGYMAVYVCAMVMGNHKFIYHNGIGRFYDGVSWLMQVILFSMLGLLCFPSKIWEVKYPGLAVALFLMFIARPIAVFVCLESSRFSFRERLFVSWVGLRGGAPIMLATFPLMAGIGHAEMMFHAVFFIVITSVVLQGMTLMPLARLLGLAAPLRTAPRNPISFENTGTINSSTMDFEIPPHSAFHQKRLAEIHLPQDALVLLIRRDSKFLVPRGDAILQSGDTLTIIAPPDTLEELAPRFEEVQAEA